MAILKRGSNGRPVEELQNLLNKFGVRPQLAVDGIFGPLTDAGLRGAQKKLRETADGKAGERTMAALRYGRPLPTLDVPSYADKLVQLRAANKFNSSATNSALSISRKINEIDKVSDTERKNINRAIAAIEGPTEIILKLVTQVVELQESFDALVLTKPALAEKNAKLCRTLIPKVTATAAQFNSRLSTLNTHVKSLRSAVGRLASEIDRDAKMLEKITLDYEKTMRGIG